MSDEKSLAVKYRPTSFEDVVGQSLVLESLMNMCRSGLSNRNLLLIGPAGTGKTTLARLIGNTLNDGTLNIIELDAASNNGVEHMRDLIQQARSYPVGSKYKIFIIDEAHALSNAAWQSLLKCLEESPARSVFIFCTTNPEKIPDTINSRTQKYQLSKISPDLITNRLTYVLDKEITEGRSIRYTDDAISYIAKLSNGGLRDALTLLDTALSHTSDLNSESIIKALNLPDYDVFFSLLSAISKQDNESVVQLIDRVFTSGVNFIKWFENFHAFIMNIVKYIYIRDINRTTIPTHYIDKISGYDMPHCNICLKLANRLLELCQKLRETNYQQEIAINYLCVTKKVKA